MSKKRHRSSRRPSRSSVSPPSASVPPAPPPPEDLAASLSSDGSESSPPPSGSTPPPADREQSSPAAARPASVPPVARSADDSTSHPADDEQRESKQAQGDEPGTEPDGERGTGQEPDAAHDKPVEVEQRAKGRADDEHRKGGEERDGAQARSGDDRKREERKAQAGDSAAHDDRLHDEFFRKGEEVEKEHMAAFEAAVNDDRPSQTSDAPVTHNLASDPALVARRARLRRVVAWVLVPAVVVAIVGGAKLVSHAESTRSSTSASPSLANVSPRPLTTNPARTAEPAAPRAPAAQDPSPSVALSASAEPQAAGSQEPPVAAAASSAPQAPPAAESASAAPSPATEPAADLAATRKQTLKLLNQGKFKDALPLAESALAADPSDATLFLYVGTALEELGRGKEAVAVYSRCVHEATKGPIAECRAVGGK